MSITALNSVDDFTPREGARVRLLVEDAYLSQYTGGRRGAMGAVVSCTDRGAYVRFDGHDQTVWVGYDEIAEVIAMVDVPGDDGDVEVALTMVDLCDADLRRDCRIVKAVAAQVLVLEAPRLPDYVAAAA